MVLISILAKSVFLKFCPFTTYRLPYHATSTPDAAEFVPVKLEYALSETVDKASTLPMGS